MFIKGEKFHLKFNITDKVYEGFRCVFRDENPMHVNANFAKNKGFKDKIVYGNVLNGFISYFVGECLPTKEVIIIYQEIFFSNPFFVGDNLDFYATVNDVFDSVNVVEFKFSFQRNEEVKIAKGKVQIKSV